MSFLPMSANDSRLGTETFTLAEERHCGAPNTIAGGLHALDGANNNKLASPFGPGLFVQIASIGCLQSRT
jgi:hypothetical protein